MTVTVTTTVTVTVTVTPRFDGQIILPYMTPAQLEMEDGDVVDVFITRYPTKTVQELLYVGTFALTIQILPFFPKVCPPPGPAGREREEGVPPLKSGGKEGGSRVASTTFQLVPCLLNILV